MSKLFGTDGIRGKVNRDPLVPEKILSVGFGLGEYWKKNSEAPERIIIGHDGRRSSTYLENLLSAALLGIGFDVVRLSLTSTPALSFLTRQKTVAGGIMISASHNPFHDNGIKPFQSSGEKFTDEQETMVEKIIDRGRGQLAVGEKVGTCSFESGWLADYITILRKRDINYEGHVVIDCANGSNSALAPAVLEGMCEELTVLNNQPDGLNINRGCGSLHVDKLAAEIKKIGADIGFAFDGDGDRVLAVDEQGDVVDGDALMYAIAHKRSAQQDGKDGLVITVMSNLGLRRTLDKEKIDYRIVGVGDRQVYEKMKELDWSLGGEQSGHIIDRSWVPTGDGLNTVVNLLAMLSAQDSRLVDINAKVPNYPQVLYNIAVKNKPPLEQLARTSELIADVEEKLRGEGRVLVRYSGTEPLARIMLEGKKTEEITKYAEKIGDLMAEEIEANDS